MKGFNLHSRKTRATLETLKRAGIWIFLVFFLFSVVGVTLITTAASR